jgi:hypothetical protein
MIIIIKNKKINTNCALNNFYKNVDRYHFRRNVHSAKWNSVKRISAKWTIRCDGFSEVGFGEMDFSELYRNQI